MATEIASHASRLLEAMYEAFRADTNQDTAIASYFEKAGLDPTQEGFDVVDFAADKGWVKTHHTKRTPRGIITADGIHTVQDLQGRRADPKAAAGSMTACGCEGEIDEPVEYWALLPNEHPLYQ